MTTPSISSISYGPSSLLARAVAAARRTVVVIAALAVVACGGSAEPPPPPESGGAALPIAPVITQQPQTVAATVGQGATFTVAATGTAPLTYQWQRNDVAIAGATDPSYSLAAVAVSDDGAVFRAVVGNVAGTATSDAATLTVVTAAPVLTITQQPADVAVAAGASAAFTVAATCSSGTLGVQWQRDTGGGAGFVAIAGATGTTLTLATVLADSGAHLRAALDCSGQSGANSTAAALTVNAPGGVRLDPLNVVGLHDQATTGFVSGIAVDPSGSFSFVTNRHVVKRLSADLSTITKVAGSPGTSGAVDGPVASATFTALVGIASDAAGNLYLTDGSRIRRIGIDGNVVTLAGSDSAGNVDGTGSAARFADLRGIAIGADGDLYVADRGNHNIRRVSAAGVASTYAGSTAPGGGPAGFADNASALSAQFNTPEGVAVAANGDVLVADSRNHRIRRIARNGNAAGAVSTLAGSGTVDPVSPDGVGTAAVIELPTELALRGNTLTVLQDVGLVRQIDLGTAAVTTLAGTYRSSGSGYADGGRGSALFNIATGMSSIVAMADGRFIVGDQDALHVIDAGGKSTTIAVNSYSGTGYAEEGGMLAQRPFVFVSNGLQTLTVDADGNTVVAANGDVRRIGSSGSVSVVAGLPGGQQQMLDGVGTNAQFTSLGSGIAAAPDNTLYVSDAESLRKIDAAGHTTLLAGFRIQPNDFSGTPPFGAVDGDAATARFQNSLALAVGPDGALYVADTFNRAIRRVDAAGNTTTYAGALGVAGTNGGTRTTARFFAPGAIAFAPDGSLYVVDNGNLRRISADGSSVTGIGGVSAVGKIAIDAAGNLFFSASSGLYMIAAGATAATQVIAGGAGDAVAFGAAPHLGPISSIAVAGPKQIVMISGFQLVKATLP